MLGELEGFSTSSSACLGSQLAARWLLSGRKRTSCAKAPVNRSASNAIVVREVYPMMLKEMEEDMAVLDWWYCLFPRLREKITLLFNVSKITHFFDVYVSHISVQPYQVYVSFYVRVPGYKLKQFILPYADILFSSHRILTAFSFFQQHLHLERFEKHSHNQI